MSTSAQYQIQTNNWESLTDISVIAKQILMKTLRLAMKTLRLEQFRRKFNELLDNPGWYQVSYRSPLFYQQLPLLYQHLRWYRGWYWDWRSNQGEVSQALRTYSMYGFTTGDILSKVRQYGEELIEKGELVIVSPAWITSQAKRIIKDLAIRKCLWYLPIDREELLGSLAKINNRLCTITIPATTGAGKTIAAFTTIQVLNNWCFPISTIFDKIYHFSDEVDLVLESFLTAKSLSAYYLDYFIFDYFIPDHYLDYFIFDYFIPDSPSKAQDNYLLWLWTPIYKVNFLREMRQSNLYLVDTLGLGDVRRSAFNGAKAALCVSSGALKVGFDTKAIFSAIQTIGPKEIVQRTGQLGKQNQYESSEQDKNYVEFCFYLFSLKKIENTRYVSIITCKTYSWLSICFLISKYSLYIEETRTKAQKYKYQTLYRIEGVRLLCLSSTSKFRPMKSVRFCLDALTITLNFFKIILDAVLQSYRKDVECSDWMPSNEIVFTYIGSLPSIFLSMYLINNAMMNVFTRLINVRSKKQYFHPGAATCSQETEGAIVVDRAIDGLV